jgi:hypothetical protein
MKVTNILNFKISIALENKDLCFNEVWDKFLRKNVEKTLKKEKILKTKKDYSDIEKINNYSQHNLLETKVKDLDYNESDTFYTKQFMKELVEIMKPGEFLGMNKEGQKKIQGEIKALNMDEHEWKKRVKKGQHNSEPHDELFPGAKKKFETFFSDYLNPSSEDLKRTQRAERNYFKFKFKEFVFGFSDVLVREADLEVMSFVEKFDDSDFDAILSKHFSKTRVYQDLVKVISKMSHDNLFSSTKRESQGFRATLTETSLVVARTSVFYEFRRVFGLSLMMNVLNYYEEKNPEKELDVGKIGSMIRNFLYRNSTLYDRNDYLFWSRAHSDNCMNILTFLEKSGIFADVISEKKKVYKQMRKEIQYVLPVKMENLVMRFVDLPNVFPPNKVNDKYLDENLTLSLFGETGITKSKSFKKVLSIVQAKKFSINETYLNVLKELLNNASFLGDLLKKTPNLNVEFPFLLSTEYAKLIHDLGNYKTFFGNDIAQRYLVDEVSRKLAGKKASNVNMEHIRNLCGASRVELETETFLRQQKNESGAAFMKRKHAASCISVSEAFIGFPIFITSSFCVRLRIYPNESLIARTSGVYKQLLCDYTATEITMSGVVELLRCYYTIDNRLLCKYEDFLEGVPLSENGDPVEIYSFFEENHLDFSGLKDNIMYASVLHAEIIISKETGKTKVNVEIDQTASAICFLALFLRNRRMAEVSNIITDSARCPYEYCMSAFPEFYNKQMEFKSEAAFDFISKNRKLHKYALMCWCYAQKTSGRSEDFIERWMNDFGEIPAAEEKACLLDFSKKYESFINCIFPNVSKQIKVLLEVVALVATETGKMRIATLEGEKIWWKRFKHSSIVRNGFDPVTHAKYSYRVETSIVRKGTKVLENSVGDHKTKALSYIIHSMDAAIVQRITLLMYEKHGYTVNTLHDCFLMHPNFVSRFYDLIYDVFSTDEIYNSANSCLFDVVKSDLSEASRGKLEKLKSKFFSYSDDFREDLVKINPRFIYKPES